MVTSDEISPPAPQERVLELLSSMLIQITALRTMVDDEQHTASDPAVLSEGLQTLEQMMRHALQIVRLSQDEEIFPELEGATLAETLARQVEDMAERLHLSSRIAISGVDEQARERTLSRGAERLLFLVTREALYQVQYHSEARRLRLQLHYGQDDVQLSIEDDGINGELAVAIPVVENDSPVVPVPSIPVREPAVEIWRDLQLRSAHLGGTLAITSAGERGTRVQVSLPYIAPTASEDTAGSDTSQASTLASQTQRSDEQKRQVEQEVISILIVDTQTVTRAGLHHLLEGNADLVVVGEAADGVQAVSETLELGPRIVLLDAHLPNGQSLEALRQIKALNLETRVIMLSTQEREEYLYETLRAGADGYVLKDIVPAELVHSIRSVARGEVLIQPQLAGRLLSRFGKQGTKSYETLTARELEVLRLLARGLRNKEIAARLFVSERTVNFHLANIYQKLNVSGRTEALSKALEQGLI